jgi:hypothetical protein
MDNSRAGLAAVIVRLGQDSGIVAMYVVAFIVCLAAFAAANSPAAAQSGQMEVAELKIASASIKRELAHARVQEKRACRKFLFFDRSGSRACRTSRARVSKLQRGVSAPDRRQANALQGRSRSTFRTICVRVCDGYYYPLSHAASRKQLARYAEKCVGQYPPGEAVMFYHPFPDGDASQAVSLNGERYVDQKYAFVFRSKFVPRCAARLHEGLAALQGRVVAAVPALAEQLGKMADAEVADLSVPMPIARPGRSSDPETYANREGDLVPKQVSSAVTTALTKHAIRTVGDPHHPVEAKSGPPERVAGYEPPQLAELGAPQWAMVPPTSPR